MPRSSDSSAPFGLYVHVPYCRSRCHYCAFTFRPGHRTVPAPYLDSLALEVDRRAGDPRFAGRAAHSIYFGGGTPSLLAPAQLVTLVGRLRDRFEVATDAEISLEANPEGLDVERLAAFRDAGVNRLTLGIQSVRAEGLRVLTRTHSPEDGFRAIETARAAGLDNLGVDLIFGRPGQTPADWRDELEAVAAAGPDHVSAYELTVEEGTRLAVRRAAGRFAIPAEDDRAAMFEETEVVLDRHGIARYEISNFARPGRECAHNLAGWLGGDLLGFGPSAASHVAETRWKNSSGPEGWAEAVSAGADLEEEVETLSESVWAAEDLYLGLRTIRGIDAGARLARVPAADRAPLERALERNLAAGFLERFEGRTRLTPRGRLLADSVFEDLLGA